MLLPAKFIRPCIPTTAKAIPQGDAWLHEPKLDGYRFQIVKDGHQVRLYSRSGYEWTRRLPALAETLRGLPCHSVVLDGELCLPGPGGAPDFRGLQGALGSRGDELAVYVFDLLRRDEDDLTDVPLNQRKQLLMRLVGREFPCLHPVQTFEDGAKLLEAAERHGLEGIVSKRKASAYHSGPSRDWVKTKTAAWREANRERWRMFEKGWGSTSA
jgi:bifunctional non-homologous end joining protein LigD